MKIYGRLESKWSGDSAHAHCLIPCNWHSIWRRLNSFQMAGCRQKVNMRKWDYSDDTDTRECGKMKKTEHGLWDVEGVCFMRQIARISDLAMEYVRHLETLAHKYLCHPISQFTSVCLYLCHSTPRCFASRAPYFHGFIYNPTVGLSQFIYFLIHPTISLSITFYE